jgi:CRISPR-associated exonuclease Cas4
MIITGLSIHYFYYCHRKLWLYSHGIKMEHVSELVTDGKILHEESYERRSEKFKNIDIGAGVIDYADIKRNLIFETKRSSSNIKTAEMQLKLYLYILDDEKLQGVIEIPRERKRINVILTRSDKLIIKNDIDKIKEIVNFTTIPNKLENNKCKKCSYFEYCYS